jgi:exosortase
MTTVLAERPVTAGWRMGPAPWLALGAALALLYVPTYLGLAQGLWRDDEYAHGPLILALFAWLAWRERAALGPQAGRPARLPGALLVAAGLALYAVGRSQSIPLFEVASHLPLFAGLALLAGGWVTLSRLGFAIAFLFFLVPLPGFILAAATGPLKVLVSAAVAAVLNALGEPVTRSGVVLAMGERQILVADACSGLNSLFALFALTALYAHLTGGVRRPRAALLLAAVAPVAVAANVLRVLLLALVVFHFGEAAAEGPVHVLGGMLVFATALALILAIDRLVPKGERAPERRARVAPRRRRAAAGLLLTLASLAIGATAIAAPALAPVASPRAAAPFP